VPSWHLDSAPSPKHCASSGWRINPVPATT
jgi:hypothetical protein